MRILWQSSLLNLERAIFACFSNFAYYAGPLFILIALSLVALCVHVYFSVITPYVFPPSETDAEPTSRTVLRIVNTIWSVYVVYCIGFHYFMAVTTKPGTPEREEVVWERKEGEEVTIGAPSSVTAATDPEAARPLIDPQSSGPYKRFCKKCKAPKPDRTHHCSVCNKCIMKMDHHCPWLHNCVGHFNHRYFYLFLVYMSIACIYYACLGARLTYRHLYHNDPYNWPNSGARTLLVFTMLLAVVIGAAIFGMAAWHTFLIGSGQTTIEHYANQDNAVYARARGDVFINEYDLGTIRNFRIFFNIGHKYKWYTVFVPWPIPPYGDGKVWPTLGALPGRGAGGEEGVLLPV
ncbi:hypothetical protein HDV00_005831 [Rhizophlyctis rosea]|nr:hypothetical protein HDV00_005831 [Rhizophlyctis rosea]